MRFGVAFTLLGLLCACEQQGGETGVNPSIQVPQSNESNEAPKQKERMYLKNASMEDYAPYTVDDGGGIKVVICHVPPGNPMNFRTHIVSIQSLQAHLNHGSERNQNQKNEGHQKAKPQSCHSNGHNNKTCDEEESPSDVDQPFDEDYIDEDYLGACGAPEPYDDLIAIDDPIYPEDGIVCEGLKGEALFDCLSEHLQSIDLDL